MTRILSALLLFLASQAVAAPNVARTAATPALHTIEQDIAELLQPTTLAVGDPMAVFAFVLGQLPERVQVLPTENYFYFRFIHKGVPYAGNIRLAASDRDRGRVHFAYGVQPSDWQSEPSVNYVELDAAKGVEVTRIAPLNYRVSYQGRAIVFALSDMASARLPADALRPDEQSLGPIFDESGVRFFLVFNTRLKVFHYLLDETVALPDELFAAGASGAILVGKRSGFAFYQDGNRKILIGAHERNSRLNTLLDGPFDQLPENFVEGEALRDAIVAASPGVKDKIDRLGNFLDDSGRYLIHPYLLYRDLRDLAVFHNCVTSRKVAAAQRPRCFVIDDDEAQKRNPRPQALRRR